MKRFYFATAFFLFLVLTVTGQLRRPNVVLIMADDLGYETLGCDGGLSYDTPTLDSLASIGIRYTECFSQPLGSPSRVKIMTGKYNFRNYEDFGYLNPKERSFGTLMKDAGYITCIAGKWQLNGLARNNPGNQDVKRPYSFGFDEYCLWQLNHPEKDGGRYANPLITVNGKDLRRDDDSYGPDIFCRFILDFIDKYSSQPFFVYYPMVLVHEPFVPTPNSPGWKKKSLRNKNDTAFFKDMVAYTDDIVHRIVMKLKDDGVWNNTILIFTADNGTNRMVITKTIFGKVQGGKGMSLNSGNHVPLITSWPAMDKRARVYKGLISFADFFPTLAEIAGVAKYQFKNDGVSFMNILTGADAANQDEIFIHYSPGWGNLTQNRWVMDGKYKLYLDGRFFNTSTDPLETRPLLRLSPEERDKKDRFNRILTEKGQEFPFSKNNPSLKP